MTEARRYLLIGSIITGGTVVGALLLTWSTGPLWGRYGWEVVALVLLGVEALVLFWSAVTDHTLPKTFVEVLAERPGHHQASVVVASRLWAGLPPFLVGLGLLVFLVVQGLPQVDAHAGDRMDPEAVLDLVATYTAGNAIAPSPAASAASAHQPVQSPASFPLIMPGWVPPSLDYHGAIAQPSTQIDQAGGTPILTQGSPERATLIFGPSKGQTGYGVVLEESAHGSAPSQGTHSAITIGGRAVTKTVTHNIAGDTLTIYTWEDADVFFTLTAQISGPLTGADVEAMIASIPR